MEMTASIWSCRGSNVGTDYDRVYDILQPNLDLHLRVLELPPTLD